MEEYDYIRAIVDDGELRMEYQVKGLEVAGSDCHEENVTGWSDDDIIECVAMTLGLGDADRKMIEVQHG